MVVQLVGQTADKMVDNLDDWKVANWVVEWVDEMVAVMVER